MNHVGKDIQSDETREGVLSLLEIYGVATNVPRYDESDSDVRDSTSRQPYYQDGCSLLKGGPFFQSVGCNCRLTRHVIISGSSQDLNEAPGDVPQYLPLTFPLRSISDANMTRVVLTSTTNSSKTNDCNDNFTPCEHLSRTNQTFGCGCRIHRHSTQILQQKKH